VACVLVGLLVVSAWAQEKGGPEAKPKVDPTGAWEWGDTPGKPGKGRLLELKLEKGKLTGVYVEFAATRRRKEWPIKDATFKAGAVAFTVVLEHTAPAPRQTMRFTGKVAKDALKGHIMLTLDTRTGSSATVVLDWLAERVVAAPAAAKDKP
jgi:hypothetical protein